MALELTAKVAPKNAAFLGMVDASEVVCTSNYLGDTSSNELIEFPAAVGSATNHIKVSNAPNSSGPTIEAVGSSDANIDLNLTPKGDGQLVLDGLSWPIADGTANYVLETDGAGNLGWVAQSGGSSAPFDDATAIVKGSADATKLVRFEVDGLTTGTTRTITVPDSDFTLTTPNSTPVTADTLVTYSDTTGYVIGSSEGTAIVRLGSSNEALGFRDATTFIQSTASNQIDVRSTGSGGVVRLYASHATGSIELNATTVKLGGALDTHDGSSSYVVRLSKGADVASANPLTLGTDGNYFDITGTNNFTAITQSGVLSGTTVRLHFDGVLTMTDSANLVLPGGNITTAAGDEAEFVYDSSISGWRCTSYQTDVAPGGSGTVTGPGTSTDNALPKFDGAGTGDDMVLQESGIIVDDSDNVSGVGNITLTGTVGGVDIQKLSYPNPIFPTYIIPEDAKLGVARFATTTNSNQAVGVNVPDVDDISADVTYHMRFDMPSYIPPGLTPYLRVEIMPKSAPGTSQSFDYIISWDSIATGTHIDTALTAEAAVTESLANTAFYRNVTDTQLDATTAPAADEAVIATLMIDYSTMTSGIPECLLIVTLVWK